MVEMVKLSLAGEAGDGEIAGANGDAQGEAPRLLRHLPHQGRVGPRVRHQARIRLRHWQGETLLLFIEI